jgi:hypothetical protein
LYHVTVQIPKTGGSLNLEFLKKYPEPMGITKNQIPTPHWYQNPTMASSKGFGLVGSSDQRSSENRTQKKKFIKAGKDPSPTKP